VVLGNHDLHLLSRWRGVAAAKRKDSFGDVLRAPDCDELLEWLLGQPLVVRRESWLLVHAGLLPAWSAAATEELAAEASAVLRGPKGAELLELLAHKAPVQWDDRLRGLQRHAAVIRCLCNLRVVDAQGQPRLGFTDAPEHAPDGLLPWYDAPDRQSRDLIVVCGHWAAQGLRIRDDMVALDSGAVWGGMLSAVRLEDRTLFQVPLADPITGPGPRRRNR
jgi:bis(5'-nucleosyl)-tetraphosphatase (symmetrical)